MTVIEVLYEHKVEELKDQGAKKQEIEKAIEDYAPTPDEVREARTRPEIVAHIEHYRSQLRTVSDKRVYWTVQNQIKKLLAELNRRDRLVNE